MTDLDQELDGLRAVANRRAVRCQVIEDCRWPAGARAVTADPSIAAYRGRIVKITSGGMLVEFVSAVDAARCAATDPTACASIFSSCRAVHRRPLRRSRYNGLQIVCRTT